jgi:DNA-binding YbaB/EbfC family protein
LEPRSIFRVTAEFVESSPAGSGADAASKTVEAQSGGGMVRVTVDGSMQVRRIQIDPSLLASNDQAMLEDLITVAVNEGLRQAQNLVAAEMGKLAPMGAFKFPGME